MQIAHVYTVMETPKKSRSQAEKSICPPLRPCPDTTRSFPDFIPASNYLNTDNIKALEVSSISTSTLPIENKTFDEDRLEGFFLLPPQAKRSKHYDDRKPQVPTLDDCYPISLRRGSFLEMRAIPSVNT